MSPGAITILAALVPLFGLLLALLVELRKTRVTAQLTRDSTAKVEYEMKPNTGGSLRDAVNRLGTKHDALDDKIDKVVERLTRMEARSEVLWPRHRGKED
jgi:hypothetical protein